MQKVIGGILLGIGILIAGLSGLCTVLTVGSELLHPGGGGGDDFAADIPGDLVIGGVPFVVGVSLIVAGRFLIKASKAGQ